MNVLICCKCNIEMYIKLHYIVVNNVSDHKPDHRPLDNIITQKAQG